MLTDLQKDVLGEIMNTNIGVAASLLSEMVNQKILLSVPELDLRGSNEFNFMDAGGKFSNFSTSVLSSMKFGKSFSGSAYLIFPADYAKDLVVACTGPENLDMETGYSKLTTEDIDVIKEISNVILNAIVGEFASLLELELTYSLPLVNLAIIENVERTIFPDDIHFLTMYTSFSLSKSQLKGMIFIALSLDSMQMLIDKINSMLVDVNG